MTRQTHTLDYQSNRDEQAPSIGLNYLVEPLPEQVCDYHRELTELFVPEVKYEEMIEHYCAHTIAHNGVCRPVNWDKKEYIITSGRMINDRVDTPPAKGRESVNGERVVAYPS